MPENSRKITALMLILFLGAVHLTIDLAHRHLAPPEKNPVAQIQLPGPKLQNSPPLCPACFFAHAQQSIHRDLAFAVDRPPAVVVRATTSALFSQFQNTPCHNRAPPA
jgi:hypothetical protein